MQSLVKFHTGQLDIRKIISNSITLRDFLRSFLTQPQKVLLAHQRTRVATKKLSTAKKKASKFADHSSSDEEAFMKFSSSTFVQQMTEFEPTN